MEISEQEYLAHYGILRKSGRYPWGSGANPLQRSKSFLDTVDDLKAQGYTDPQIAKMFHRDDAPFTTNTLRANRSIALNERKQAKINEAQRLQDKGMSTSEIGRRMGLNESSVRLLLAPGARDKADVLQATASMLRRQVEEKGAIDIGTQVEQALPLSADNPAQLVGISSTKLKVAVNMLEQEGYVTHQVKVPQAFGRGRTTIKVLAKPDVQWKDLVRNPSLIKPIAEHSEDGGRTFTRLRKPTDVSSKRIKIAYDEDGGGKRDGLIEIRPGAKDLDLGKARYAQVRISVDGTHYLKGMAIYNPDLPPGTDIRFNTNKSKKVGKMGAMKEHETDSLTGKVDPLNPFNVYIKPGGQRGALNIINEEGDWDNWSRSLPSQMLSKQSPSLAKTQLDLTSDRRRRELDSILELTNPSVKRLMLKTYSDETDSAAVDLDAASRPKQATKVLIPVTSVKETQIYAPTFRDGERVALVRFPHGGTFEIPEVTVNNRNPEARKLLGNAAKDAVGINHKVAEQLSGADFDGDTVLVIPNPRGEVKHTSPLDGLKDFDPRRSYPAYDGMRTVDGGRYNAKKGKVEYPPGGPRKSNMQNEMGKISNLITDMTIKGAPPSEIVRAVRHSMVVIDSEKHSLDHRASSKDNNIVQLKKKYQLRPDGKPGGAATVLSRATAPESIPLRKPRPAAEGGPIDKKTGKLVFVETGEVHYKSGKKLTTRVKRLSVTEDAHKLVSDPKPGTEMEQLYADHSNKLKGMANEARREMLAVKSTPVSKSAKKVYKREVESLDAKLRRAEKNAPLERQAQALQYTIVSQKRRDNPTMTSDQEKKTKRLALEEARFRTGAGKHRIEVTQDEWNAIQAGAFSASKLDRILRNSDLEKVREFATPKQRREMTSAKISRAKAMLAQGFTQAEVADALGVAVSTLKLGLA